MQNVKLSMWLTKYKTMKTYLLFNNQARRHGNILGR